LYPKNATNILPIDIEIIVVKIYTVRVDNLKTYCNNIEIKYKKMLSLSKTTFFSLLPAIERVLQMSELLKQHFETIECPTI